MKSSTKGALFSGLIFPGLGQIVLKKYMRGIIIMFLVCLSLGVIVAMAVSNAIQSIEALQNQGTSIDMTGISHQVTVAMERIHTYLIICLFFIFCCWIISIVDAYRIGKQIDLNK